MFWQGDSKEHHATCRDRVVALATHIDDSGDSDGTIDVDEILTALITLGYAVLRASSIVR